MRLALSCALLCVAASPALADDPVMRPRVAAHLAMGIVFGPEVRVAGNGAGHTGTPFPLPAPAVAARFELPLLEPLVAGVQADFTMWRTRAERDLGYGTHYTGNYSLFAAWRWLWRRDGSWAEIYTAVLGGPSLDGVSTDETRFRTRVVESPLAFHLGALVGYLSSPTGSPLGWAAELGATYHRVVRTFAYPDSASEARDRVVYQPIALFARFGVVLRF